ncbi:hypothetical protein PoB_005307200 [Plakobranchus ocellatus]|uniref:Uncharacterized protein n=1 Tax=Plakobranchus ocellatus TaxID=259542 RepID=A0AAV4C5K3_9GAST|nr:hypothetical protein PoB_005307200 [Plakobranchus ocellatus]
MKLKQIVPENKSFPHSPQEKDLRADSLVTVPPRNRTEKMNTKQRAQPSFMPVHKKGDLRLSNRQSGRDNDGGTRTHDRRVHADVRARSLSTEPHLRPTYAYLEYREIMSVKENNA